MPLLACACIYAPGASRVKLFTLLDKKFLCMCQTAMQCVVE